MGKETPSKRERLEVPAVTGTERSVLVREAIGLPRQKPRIGPVNPPELLGRLQAFLPAMRQANEKLQMEVAAAADPGAFDVENVTEGEAHVEMDVHCGVLELRDEAALRAAEAALRAGNPDAAVERFGGDATSSSSESDVSDMGQEAGSAGRTMGAEGGQGEGEEGSRAEPERVGQGAGRAGCSRGQKRRPMIEEL